MLILTVEEIHEQYKKDKHPALYLQHLRNAEVAMTRLKDSLKGNQRAAAEHIEAAQALQEKVDAADLTQDGALAEVDRLKSQISGRQENTKFCETRAQWFESEISVLKKILDGLQKAYDGAVKKIEKKKAAQVDAVKKKLAVKKKAARAAQRQPAAKDETTAGTEPPEAEDAPVDGDQAGAEDAATDSERSESTPDPPSETATAAH